MERGPSADLPVEAILQRAAVTIRCRTSLARAAALMLEHGVNALPVLVEHGRLAGLIGIRDVLRVPLPHGSARPIIRWDRLEEKAALLAATPVGRVMARPVVTVGPGARVIAVAALMANRGIHPTPVVVGGDLVGIVGRADVAGSPARPRSRWGALAARALLARAASGHETA